MKRTAAIGLLTCALYTPLAGLSEERVDAGINGRIREEGTSRSQVLKTLHYLTDVYGPRLTGSPNLRAAQEWAVKRMESWGMKNGHLEAWDFGRPGWLNERLAAHITAPVKDSLTCEALGWTPGTSGAVAGPAVQMPLPDRPTAEDLEKHLAGYADRVGGRIVLAGKPQFVSVSLNPPPRRREDQQVRSMYDPKNPRPGGGFGPPREQQPQQDPNRLTNNQIAEKVDAFLVASGARLKISDAGMTLGHIRAFANRTYDLSKAVPSVVMRNEDYGRIWRILDDGTPVELEFEIVNRVYPEGKTAYNAIAEIPGTDRPDEVVMIGAHIDSWHAATGATDNAVGCAVMMEAARILAALGVQPRRTIRVGLWGGEEQGLLGSLAYVKQHFGTAEDPKPEHARLSAYLNIDSGTGRARGMSIFGPPEAGDVLREILAPFEDLGVIGASANGSRRIGGTDSTSFSNAGLPGVGIGQDPIEYFLDTWHTNLDTYERVIEEDARSSAIAIASVVYHLATREEMIPRFPKDKMPAQPAPPARP